ncbi:hypothetical protein VIGAN_02228000 [Vigna angularis var. angularis]|uniref:Uncharacterized protein n=1 Tax=Vigna angularis var. angularis TaxID=157739 RepID=A0A0S3RFE4_PHAAN|nr:hypothetical protein VIGAN_02228000 [Vigna angularis var. angularis]
MRPWLARPEGRRCRLRFVCRRRSCGDPQSELPGWVEDDGHRRHYDGTGWSENGNDNVYGRRISGESCGGWLEGSKVRCSVKCSPPSLSENISILNFRNNPTI